MIAYNDFKKIELKAGTILVAKRVEGSEKLLRLELDLGVEKRQIIAGIGKSYEPAVLIGKQIIIVANLEPRTMMGLESQGMLLAASSESGPILLTTDAEVPDGSEIR